MTPDECEGYLTPRGSEVDTLEYYNDIACGCTSAIALVASGGGEVITGDKSWIQSLVQVNITGP